jgi:hypothetical protein
MRIIGGGNAGARPPCAAPLTCRTATLVSSRRGACPKRSLTGSFTTTGTPVMACCLSYSLILLQQWHRAASLSCCGDPVRFLGVC